MLDYFYSFQAGSVIDYLMSGRPPIITRLLALNAIFLAIYAIRKSAGAQHMSFPAMFATQAFMLGANVLILYQHEALALVASFMDRF